MPKKLFYSLRFPSELRSLSIYSGPSILNWHTFALFPLYATSGPRSRDDHDGGPPWYYREGFVPIQDAIARAFVRFISGNNMPDVMLQRLPYPPFNKDILLEGLKSLVSLVILLSFIYPCINTVRFIAIEKEKQLKEAMKIMGLPNWLHWLGWFIKSMVFMMISITFIVLLLKVNTFYIHHRCCHQLLQFHRFLFSLTVSDVHIVRFRVHIFQYVNSMGVFLHL